MKKIIYLLLCIFSGAFLSAQDCTIFPNTKNLIYQNGVKKQTITAEDKFKHEKYVLEVLFFDSLGNCFKKVERDQSGYSKNYTYATWSVNNKSGRFYEYGYYNKEDRKSVV